MSYTYDPNQNPRSGVSGPAGGNQSYGQNYGQDAGQGGSQGGSQGGNQSFGQPYDDEETVGYPPQAGYPSQGYQGYPAQGSYSRPVAGGQAGQLNNPTNPYAPADANGPVIVRAGTTGRNWLPYLVVGIVLVALVCCVLPGAVLLRNNNIFGNNTTQSTPAAGAIVYQATMLIPDNRWPATKTCGFQTAGYAITDNNTCIATYSNVPNDLSISTSVVQTSGPATLPHGIALRRTDPNDYYVFGITSSGSWVFIKYANNKTPLALSPFKSSTAIKTGLNASNTLEVRASGSNFYFFINGASVGQTSDNSYGSGLPGLTGDSGATVVYTNFTIAKLA